MSEPTTTGPWGVYNDEGMIDGPYYTRAEAEEQAATYPADEQAHVAVVEDDEPDDDAS